MQERQRERERERERGKIYIHKRTSAYVYMTIHTYAVHVSRLSRKNEYQTEKQLNHFLCSQVQTRKVQADWIPLERRSFRKVGPSRKRTEQKGEPAGIAA